MSISRFFFEQDADCSTKLAGFSYSSLLNAGPLLELSIGVALIAGVVDGVTKNFDRTGEPVLKGGWKMTRIAVLTLFSVFSLMPGDACRGDEKNLSVALEVGEKAPVFEAAAEDGRIWKSADHVGKKVIVVYFYPADMTGGCTKQACAFRDDLSKLNGKGVEVVGVSGDSVENHQLFRKAHNLNFTLLADTEGKVAEAFGVPITRGEKKVQVTIDGEEHLLVRNVTSRRWTFVIDRSGKIAAKNTMVQAADDSKAVAQIVDKLSQQ